MLQRTLIPIILVALAANPTLAQTPEPGTIPVRGSQETRCAEAANRGAHSADAECEAERAGSAAAEAVAVGRYTVVGVLGGYIGTMALPIVPFSLGAAAVAGGGYYSVIATRNHAERSGTLPSPAWARAIALQPEDYQRRFRVAYGETLRERRVRATWRGGLIGGGAAIVTYGIFAYLLSNSEF